MAALVLSTSVLPVAFVGVYYEVSFAVQTLGVAPYALVAGTTQTGKNALPASLAYGTSGAHAGQIFGTPLPADAGTYLLSIKISDSGATNSLDNIAMTLVIYDAKNSIGALQAATVVERVSVLNLH
jgi:hypothetical protein